MWYVGNYTQVTPIVSLIIVTRTFPNSNLDKMLGSINKIAVRHEVIIVTCNIASRADIKGCLSKLRVRDKNLTSARVLVTYTDKGLSYGRNIGASLSASSNLIFADDDAVVLDDVTQIIQFLEKDVCQGGQPLILRLENNQIIDSSGDFLSEETPFTYCPYPRHYGKSIKAVDQNLCVEEIPSMRGAFMIVQKKALQAVGGFDNNFCFLYEDVDLGWRMVSAGYKLLLVPNVRALHKGGKGTNLKTLPDRIRREGFLNFCLLNMKMRPFVYWPFIFAIFFKRYLLFEFFNVIRNKKYFLCALNYVAPMVILFARRFETMLAHRRLLAEVFHFQGREKLTEFARGKRFVYTEQ